MIVGVPRESYPGERRVALVRPGMVPGLRKAGLEVVVEAGARRGSRLPGRRLQTHRESTEDRPDAHDVFQTADIVVRVLCYGWNRSSTRR